MSQSLVATELPEGVSFFRHPAPGDFWNLQRFWLRRKALQVGCGGAARWQASPTGWDGSLFDPWMGLLPPVWLRHRSPGNKQPLEQNGCPWLCLNLPGSREHDRLAACPPDPEST